MPKFEVTATVTLERTYIIDAPDKDEAADEAAFGLYDWPVETEDEISEEITSIVEVDE